VQPPVDMVVWPENVIDVDDFSASNAREQVAAAAARLGVPFVVGVTEEAGDNQFTNAQIVVMPDGTQAGRYDKVRRVPFGEYMPMRGFLHALGAPTNLVPRNAVAGSGPAYVDVPGVGRIAVVISWEVFFGGRAHDGVSHGGELIINPTNGSSYTWTILQTQQVASSRLRAIEEGRWVAQVAPTGFTAFVNPSGVVHDRTRVSEAAVRERTITRRQGRTLYAVIGDKTVVVLAAAVLGLASWLAARGRALTPPPSGVELEQDGDGAVVDELDGHLGAEPAGGDGGAPAP
jgi:apolipoprotein N-acyltransferase